MTNGLLVIRGILAHALAVADRYHWIFLFAASPFLLFPSPTRSVALVVVPALWILAWRVRGAALPRTPFNVILLVLYSMVLVSLFATYDVAVSLSKVAGMVLGIGVFFAFVREGQTSRGWWVCFWVYVLTGLGVAVLGILGTNWLQKVNLLSPIIARLPPRITGLPGAGPGFSGNELAGGLLWVIPLILVLDTLLLTRAKKLQSNFGLLWTLTVFCFVGVASFLMLSYLVLTQSRGGYIGFLLALFVLVLYALPSRRRWIAVGALVVMISIGLAVSRDSTGVALVRLVGGESSMGTALSLDTLEGRLEVWSRAIYAIQDFPFTGMGMNTFRYVVHVLYPLFSVSPDFDISHAHNEFLQAGLDLGLPGLIAFIALYMGAFWMLGQVWKTARPGESGPGDRILLQVLVMGCASGLIGHISYGMTDAVTFGAKPGVLFWMLLGLVTTLFQQTHSGRFFESPAGWPAGAILARIASAPKRT